MIWAFRKYVNSYTQVPNNAPDMKPRWMIKLPDPMRQSAIQNLTCEEPPCVSRFSIIFIVFPNLSKI